VQPSRTCHDIQLMQMFSCESPEPWEREDLPRPFLPPSADLKVYTLLLLPGMPSLYRLPAAGGDQAVIPPQPLPVPCWTGSACWSVVGWPVSF
jgi:hypothetical protein